MLSTVGQEHGKKSLKVLQEQRLEKDRKGFNELISELLLYAPENIKCRCWFFMLDCTCILDKQITVQRMLPD